MIRVVSDGKKEVKTIPLNQVEPGIPFLVHNMAYSPGYWSDVSLYDPDGKTIIVEEETFDEFVNDLGLCEGESYIRLDINFLNFPKILEEPATPYINRMGMAILPLSCTSYGLLPGTALLPWDFNKKKKKAKKRSSHLAEREDFYKKLLDYVLGQIKVEILENPITLEIVSGD